MITAPTAPGRRFVTRAVDILLETEKAARISKLYDGVAEQVEIFTLTDRATGQSIRLDGDMLQFLCDSARPRAQRAAADIQRLYDTHAAGSGMRLDVATAHISGDRLTVEADVTTDGVAGRRLVTARVAPEAPAYVPGSIEISDPDGEDHALTEFARTNLATGGLVSLVTLRASSIGRIADEAVADAAGSGDGAMINALVGSLLLQTGDDARDAVHRGIIEGMLAGAGATTVLLMLDAANREQLAAKGFETLRSLVPAD